MSSTYSPCVRYRLGLDIFAPVAIVGWIERIAKRFDSRNLVILTPRLIVFAVMWLTAGLIITLPSPMQFLVPLQPMRYPHLLYTLMTVFAAGMLAHDVLRDRPIKKEDLEPMLPVAAIP